MPNDVANLLEPFLLCSLRQLLPLPFHFALPIPIPLALSFGRYAVVTIRTA